MTIDDGFKDEEETTGAPSVDGSKKSKVSFADESSANITSSSKTSTNLRISSRSLMTGTGSLVEKESGNLEAVDENQPELDTRAKLSKMKSFHDIDFMQDKKSEMTCARRIALANMHRKWYYPGTVHSTEDSSGSIEFENRPPKVTSRKIPSLEKAWIYFEHFALSRFLVDEDGSYNKSDLKPAEPGECDLPTRLYNPITTPQSQMGDFGLGVGLYFATLRGITVLTIIAGLINIPNFLYFSSDEYSGGQKSLTGLQTLLRGSAICTETEWVHCTDCLKADFDHRWAQAVIGNETTSFALRNTCDGATPTQWTVHFGTLLFLLIAIIVLNLYLLRQEVKFDEDEQTAQDYSVKITNPPDDATDPDEWRTFFKECFDVHATVITVGLDNDPLIRALRSRREHMHVMEMSLEPGTSLDLTTLSKIAANVELNRKIFGKILAKLSPGIPEHFGKIAELEAKIRGWAQLRYPCSNVFVTFETEREQRAVLDAFSVGSYHIMRGNFPEEHKFRKRYVLNVQEPDEPNTIRWADLNLKTLDILKPLATSTLFSIIMIILIVLLINVINNWRPAWAAIAIALFNAAFPEIAKILTNLERHASESNIQTSLYFKIAIFRWTTTAIAMTIITPFIKTLEDDGLINSIFLIFFAEILTTNILQLCDIGGHFKRHILAPRAITQDAMNLKMQGTEISLAERYTNMTKILFLAMWYSSIYPGAFFMCAFALFINYYTDRFSMMRSWKRFPQLGTSISAFSRRYFFSTSLVLMSVISAYFWSGFPFDNLCENDSNTQLDGSITATLANGTLFQFEMSNTTSTYRYCDQELLRSASFPALSSKQLKGSEWMTQNQGKLVDISGWASIGVLGLFAAYFITLASGYICSMFRTGAVEHRGDDQGIRFSDVRSISAYIPQIHSKVFSFPLLACKSDTIDPELYDWTDPDRPHLYYDLTKDADEIVGEESINHEWNFSIISHVPCPDPEE